MLLWQILLPLFAATGALHLAGNDTTCRKSGRRVAYAAWYRDAVHSSGQQAVIHCSHQWVVLCLIVSCPFAAHKKLHLSVLARLYRREKQCRTTQRPFKTRPELLAQMIGRVRQGLPPRELRLWADGASAAAKMLASLPAHVTFTSRLRRAAALYELPPARTGKKGRAQEKGSRWPSLKEIAGGAVFTRGTVTR